VRNLLLIIAELGLLAAAQLLGGPPWTVLAAVALVLESAAGLSAAGLARLALAFVWLGIFRLTDNRELFFCYSMTLAIHLALRFAVRRWLLRAAAGGLVITVFLGFRIAQQATLKVLAVETAVACVILAASLLAQRFLATRIGGPPQAASPPSDAATSPSASMTLVDTGIVIAASLASYAGLAV
jgi:hypothetical protein